MISTSSGYTIPRSYFSSIYTTRNMSSMSTSSSATVAISDPIAISPPSVPGSAVRVE